MKRLLYIFIALIFASACSKDYAFDQSIDDDSINFSTRVKATRAVESDNTDLKGYGFEVSAYLDETDYNFVHYFDGFVTHNGSSWECDNPQYWPSTGALTFDGYGYDKTKMGGTLTKSGRTLSYISSPDVDKQVDLLTASQKVNNKQVADLNFRHALSQIKFDVNFTDTSEANITLTKINIIYHDIISSGTYNFADHSWALGSDTFGGDGYATTYMSSTDNAMMIIPQQVTITDDDNDNDRYISVSLEYTLNVAMGGGTKQVTTGTMELPAPAKTNNTYEMGRAYTYELKVSGKNLTIGLNIDAAEKPSYAYGNLDLRLITAPMSEAAYNAAVDGTGVNGIYDEYLYFSTALRVTNLLADGVRDFVVVGDFGASDDGDHDGKMGFSGYDSSPFFIAAEKLGMMPSHYETTSPSGNNIFVFDEADLAAKAEYQFSIDLRGVYGFPNFNLIHNNSTSESAPYLTDYIFKDLALLREVKFPIGLAAIGKYSFQNCVSLTSVDISEVMHIEDGGFDSCKNLVEVIGDKLERIHAHGFEGCEKLSKINLTNVTEVDDCGFLNCKALGAVNISNLTTIGENAFEGCINMVLADDSSFTPIFINVADYAFSECSKLRLNIDLTNATTVGSHAFNGCKGIHLNNGVLDDLIHIGDCAFMGCSEIGLEHPYLHIKNISTIGESAFQGCSLINIVEGLSNLTVIPDSAFQECSKLTGYKADAADKRLILDRVTSVGNFAFTDAVSLTNVAFSSGVLTDIGDYAFDDCAALTTITGLDGVETIGEYAFFSCPAIKGDVVFNDLTQIGEYALYDSRITSLTIPNIKSIGVETFANCDQLAGDVVMNQLTTLGSKAFFGCSLLSGIEMKEVGAIESETFANCTSLTSVVAPKAQSLGYAALSGCAELETLNLAGITTALGGWYFSPQRDGSGNIIFEYGKLKEVNIAAAPSVEGGTFNSCRALESVIATNAASVGAYAFQYCAALKTLDLASAETVGDAFIGGCTSLETLNLSSLTTSFSGWFFSPQKDGGVVVDPKYPHLKDVNIASVPTIEIGTFSDRTTLERVIATRATSVALYAFGGCTSLRELDLSGVTGALATPSYDWEHPFYNVPTEECVLYLNQDQIDLNVPNDNDKMWYGKVWKSISVKPAN